MATGTRRKVIRLLQRLGIKRFPGGEVETDIPEFNLGSDNEWKRGRRDYLQRKERRSRNPQNNSDA